MVKHVKPNPEQVKGARITRESPISLSKVSLLDPSLNKPTDVELAKVFNPVKGKLEWNRIATLSQSLMPIPEKDAFASKEGMSLDLQQLFTIKKRRKIGYQTWNRESSDVDTHTLRASLSYSIDERARKAS